MCTSCNEFDYDCNGANCSTCEHNCVGGECNEDDTEYFPHYDDQISGITLSNSRTNYDTHMYTKKYTIFTPIQNLKTIKKSKTFEIGDIIELTSNGYSTVKMGQQGIVAFDNLSDPELITVSWFDCVGGWSDNRYPKNSMYTIAVSDVKLVKKVEYTMEEDDVA